VLWHIAVVMNKYQEGCC